jgi:hypothetical protein
MHKIESQMIEAIRNGIDFKSGNTKVTAFTGDDGSRAVVVKLHGNVIASLHWPAVKPDNSQRNPYAIVTLSGWDTQTTRSRLNAILQFIQPANGAILRLKKQTQVRFDSRDGRTTSWEILHVHGYNMPEYSEVPILVSPPRGG